MMDKKIVLSLMAVLFSGLLMAGTVKPAYAVPAKQEETESPAEEEPAEMPGIPVPEFPQGECTSKMAGFYWIPSENTEYYEVQWQNEHGEGDKLQRKSSDWTCRMGRCILYAELGSSGSYTWTVTAVNDAGSSVSEEAEFTLNAGLTAPDAYRPAASIGTGRPVTFEWQDTGERADSFRIQVMDNTDGRIYLDRWFGTDRMFIGNGVCSKQTDVYLPTGDYSWRVKAKDSFSESGWSGWKNFRMTCSDCNSGNHLNTTTALLYPVSATLDLSPHFEWLAVTGAAYYMLNITDADGGELLNVQVPSSNCTPEVCAYKPELTFGVGTGCTWSVSTYGGNNGFWGHAEGSFQTVAPTGMNDISFAGPESDGTLDPENKQIIWTDPGPLTASFVLRIADDADETLFWGNLTRDEAWCDGITCSIQFRDIPEDGKYSIVLTPYSEYNLAGNSISMVFSSKKEEASE